MVDSLDFGNKIRNNAEIERSSSAAVKLLPEATTLQNSDFNGNKSTVLQGGFAAKNKLTAELVSSRQAHSE